MLLYNLWSEKDLQSYLKKVSQSSLSASAWACALYSLFLPFTPLSGICEKRDWLKIAGFSASSEKDPNKGGLVTGERKLTVQY